MKQESHDWLATLAEVLEANANPVQAKAMAAYMKDLFPFLGLKKPERTALSRPWLERGNRPAREDLPEVCFQLFQRPEREWAYVALELLRLERKTLEYNDLEWLMELVRTRSWWDTVDILASDMVGRTLLRYPTLGRIFGSVDGVGKRLGEPNGHDCPVALEKGNSNGTAGTGLGGALRV